MCLHRGRPWVRRRMYTVAAMRLSWRCAFAVAVLLASLGYPAAARAQDAIASCESATLEQWKYLDGSDFPGAKGSLSSVPGHTGAGAHLSYDFSGGGRYVGATFVLPSPLRADAVA